MGKIASQALRYINNQPATINFFSMRPLIIEGDPLLLGSGWCGGSARQMRLDSADSNLYTFVKNAA